MHPHLSKLFHLNIYAFILTLHIAFIIYSGSTFLSGIFGSEYIWIIYSLGAFFTIVLNFSISSLLKTFHIEKINNVVLIIAGLNLVSLSFTNIPFQIFISYILYLALAEYLVMMSSVMIEDLSKNSVTGSIRGRFIMMQSLAYIVSPFFTALTINYFGLSNIFLVGGIFIFLSLIYFKFNVKSVPEINVQDKKFWATLPALWKNYDVRTSVFIFIAMNLFYVCTTVFIPFKMESVGIPFTTYLSVLLPIALLPFLFVPTILGHVEDVMKDEKQFIIFSMVGLIIILVTFALTSTNLVWVWALILFASRVFASILETSVNSYFFKKISGSDTAVISIFQSSSPIAYLVFSPILSLVLIYGNLESVFLTVSFFLCFMLILVSKIHNTDNYEKHKTWSEIWRRTKRRTS